MPIPFATVVARVGAGVVLLAGAALPATVSAPADATPARTDRPAARAAPGRAAGPAAGAAPTEAPGRALFNDPLGGTAQQYALVRAIDRRIGDAERGATVRMAAFSFAMPSTARALLRAHRRGVVVKVVVDERSRDWKSVQHLRRVLGSDVHRRSFVRVCHASCRGPAGRQHAKFVTISRTSHARAVVMVGSMNFTAFAAARQWQDLYVVGGDERLFLDLRRLFRQMVRDTPQPYLSLPPTGTGFRLSTAPIPAGSTGDPVLARLDRVHCRGASAGTGSRGRTVLGVSMHAWNGPRGVAIARRVGNLQREGCRIRVLAGVGFGRRVTHVLGAAGVGYRDTGRSGPATHEKLMFLSGHFGANRAAALVWTGSHNWTDRSLRNDEVTLRVTGALQLAAYRADFRRIWRASGGRVTRGKPG